MPSANFIMVGWCVNVTWTPDPATYAPLTRTLRFKAHATNSAYVTSMATAVTQDMNAQNPVTLSAPFLDPDQSWVDT
jgi:hypothetical protein